MRDSGKLAVVGIALVLGAIFAPTSVTVFADVVDFPGPGLEAAIRTAMFKPTGDIQNYDLTWLTELDASERGIEGPN
ncbi:hypothetical protein IH601_06490 [Candidatus Bipolaricaulota bacterium]|nr:hypothetical protein [Candidatus Bipolaricaulota bacterium]